MRSILGLIMAGGIVLSQAGDAKAQVTFSLGGGRSPGVVIGQPYGGYGYGNTFNPGYSVAPSYPNTFNPGYSAAPSYGYSTNSYYQSYSAYPNQSYNSGYRGYTNPYAGYSNAGSYGNSYPNYNNYGGYPSYGNSGYGYAPYGNSGYGYSSGVNIQTPVGVYRIR
jgi:hypothetical protein